MGRHGTAAGAYCLNLARFGKIEMSCLVDFHPGLKQSLIAQSASAYKFAGQLKGGNSDK